MKLTVLCLLVCVIAVVLCFDQEESQSSETAKRGCRQVCSCSPRRVFRVTQYVIIIVKSCRYVCKRELQESPEDLPFPSKFEAYHPGDDGLISEQEFIKSTGVDGKSGHNAFEFSDIDGDGQLDRNEFAKAPLLKSKDDA